MDVKNITITPEAVAAIERLQHNCGTYEFYNATLTRLFNFVLDQSDEIGMDDTEAIHTLRVLQYLKEDLAQISNKARTPIIHTIEEKVESTFAGVSLAETEARNQTTEHPATGDQLDEPPRNACRCQEGMGTGQPTARGNIGSNHPRKERRRKIRICNFRPERC